MAKYTPNFKDGAEFAPIPPGVYVCRVDEAVITPIEKGPLQGLHEIKWMFSIVGGAFSARKIWNNTPLEGDYAWLSKRIIQAINPAYKGGSEAFDTADFIHKKVEVKVENQTDKSTGGISKFLRVKDVAPYREAGFGGSLVEGPAAPMPWDSDGVTL